MTHTSFCVVAFIVMTQGCFKPPHPPVGNSEAVAVKLGGKFIKKLKSIAEQSTALHIDKECDDTEIINCNGHPIQTHFTRYRRYSMTNQKDIFEFVAALERSNPQVQGGVMSGAPCFQIIFMQHTRVLFQLNLKGITTIDAPDGLSDVTLVSPDSFALWLKTHKIAESKSN